MTQQELITQLLTQPKSISQLHRETKILRPSIRKHLGQGALKGKYKRVGRGVYVLNDHGKIHAHVICGDAITTLPKLSQRGMKFDSVFLDIPYYSPQLIGRNRRLIRNQYDFITVKQFESVAVNVKRLLNPQGVVWLMLSGAKSAKQDMQKYLGVMLDNYYLVQTGEYEKLYSNGNPVLNIRGEKAANELLYAFQTFKTEFVTSPLIHSAIRPKGYNTEKPMSLIDELFSEVDSILDPFAGSGVVGDYAQQNGKRFVLIEKNEKVVENIILPRLEKSLL